MIAATFAVGLLFTGNALTGKSQAASPPSVETQLPTTAPTIPPTTEPAVNPAFAEIGAEADGEQVFIWDAGRETMLYSKEAETEKMYPASITKLYAALVALMHLSPEDTVTAGDELRLMQPGSSRAFVSRGCTLTVEMLVEAMLIPSGNDAAYVLSAAAGRAIAGDEDLAAADAVAVFVEEMNRVAEDLDFHNSHFTNPDGYHHEEHYMCPADAALVADLAWENPVIGEYMGLQQDSVRFVSGETITWYNNNLLMDPTAPCYAASAVGMKTGYTSQAGNCLLAAFRQGDRSIIVGIFGSNEKYPRYESALKFFKACV